LTFGPAGHCNSDASDRLKLSTIQAFSCSHFDKLDKIVKKGKTYGCFHLHDASNIFFFIYALQRNVTKHRFEDRMTFCIQIRFCIADVSDGVIRVFEKVIFPISVSKMSPAG
jgi:hypothetical protein